MNLPEDKDSGLNLTDISYNHRLEHLRMSEDEYREKFGDPYKCPTCRKDAYAYVEGGADSPDCDSCWVASEDLGLPKAKWDKPERPLIADKPDDFWNETNYKSKDHGLHICDQISDTTGETCGHIAESRWGLEEHWDHDPEHNEGEEY